MRDRPPLPTRFGNSHASCPSSTGATSSQASRANSATRSPHSPNSATHAHARRRAATAADTLRDPAGPQNPGATPAARPNPWNKYTYSASDNHRLATGPLRAPSQLRPLLATHPRPRHQPEPIPRLPKLVRPFPAHRLIAFASPNRQHHPLHAPQPTKCRPRQHDIPLAHTAPRSSPTLGRPAAPGTSRHPNTHAGELKRTTSHQPRTARAQQTRTFILYP